MINLIQLYKGIKSRYTIHRILMGSKLSDFNFTPGYTLDISSEKHASYEKDWNIELKNLINIDIEGKPNILADINNLPLKIILFRILDVSMYWNYFNFQKSQFKKFIEF